MTRPCVVCAARVRPSGFTLLEVIVVVAILGLIVGMTGLAFVSLRLPRQSEPVQELRRARAAAVRSGRPILSGANDAPRATRVLFLPDGRAIGAGADPLTGAPLNVAK